MNFPIPTVVGPAPGQVEAEYFVEVINEMLDAFDDDNDSGFTIVRKAGIVKITFPDGSMVDFTEPMAHTGAAQKSTPAPPPIP